MNGSEVTPTTEVRHLFRDVPKSMDKMKLILDMDESWKRLAKTIPASKNDPTPLYNLNDMRLMTKSHDGPTLALLSDWGTHGRKGERPTIEYMIQLLCRCELYRAADYLAIDILGGDPVTRNIPHTEEEMFRLGLKSGPSSSQYEDLVPTFDRMDTEPSPQGITSEKKEVGSSPVTNARFDSAHGVDSLATHILTEVDTHTGEAVFTHLNQSDQSVDFGEDVGGLPKLVSSPILESERADDEKQHDSRNSQSQLWKQKLVNCSLPHCPYRDLEAMTRGFHKSNVAEGGRRLGSGAFSTVFLGHWKNEQNGSSRKVAVKKMDMKFTEQFLMEVQLMSSFQHRCILQLFAYSADGPNCCLVYEYMVNGSLQDRLACVNNTSKLSWRLRLQIAADTAQGLVSLHSQCYVHRDVKSANILLDEELRAKLGDFGIAHVAPDPARYTSLETKVPIGTSVYMPREAFNGVITYKLDTYSFGVVLLEILTGRKPYDLETKEDLISYVEDEEIQVDNVGHYLDLNGGDWDLGAAKSVFALSQKCLSEKRKNRPNMIEVLPELLEILRKMQRHKAENSKMDLTGVAFSTPGSVSTEA